MSDFLHSTADLQSPHVGPNTHIWQFVVILPGARIGADCNICSHCFIENDVIVGDRVTIKNGVQLWDGLRIEDEVFIGPNVTFTNDKFPRSKRYPAAFPLTWVRRGASIGGGGYSAQRDDWRASAGGGGGGGDAVGACRGDCRRQPGAGRRLCH